MTDHVDRTLRATKLRTTPAREQVLAFLRSRGRPVSAERVWNGIRRAGVDRVTVYRTLETLREAGLLRTVDLRHGHRDYELDDPAAHHHHLVCEDCGRVDELRIADEERVLRRLTRNAPFTVRSHSLEFFGLCADCGTV